MIAVARSWDEIDPPERGAGGLDRRIGTSLAPIPVEVTPPPAASPKRAPLRPVARAERGLQLPLLPEEEARSRRGPDRVPELTHYRDDGCEFWRACLSCPFPRCLYDMPGGPKHALNTYRDGEMRRMFDAGHSAAAIADHFGITRRSVYRILGGVRRRAGSRESGVGSREHGTRGRSHVSRRERIRLPTPDSRLPRD